MSTMPDDELGLAELTEDDDWPDLVEWGIVEDSSDEDEILDPFEETEGYDDFEDDDDDGEDEDA